MIQKDYCGQNIEDLLAEVGFPIRDYQFCLQGPGVLIREKVSLYEAQKWLRKEKKLVVLVGFDFCPIISEIVYNWVIVVNGNTAKKSSYTYDYFEEALLEGIKEAIEILKDGIGE